MTLSHINGGFCNTAGAGHRAASVQAKLKCFARALDWGSPAARPEYRHATLTFLLHFNLLGHLRCVGGGRV